MFSPTLALPVPILGVGVLGNPLLPLPPALSKLSLLDVLVPSALTINGLPEYGLPDIVWRALSLKPTLRSNDADLVVRLLSGEPDSGEPERGVLDRAYRGGVIYRSPGVRGVPFAGFRPRSAR